jgi:putative acetyltransferase
VEIKIDDLKGKAVLKLLAEHHADMLLHSPQESVHALDLSALQASDVTFWSAWIEGKLAGCGALKELDSEQGEIKSMRTAKAFLRKGVAKEVLSFILAEASNRCYKRVNLETGTNDAFLPAQKMYQSFGFEYCQPFADYVEDPYSVFMTKQFKL